MSSPRSSRRFWLTAAGVGLVAGVGGYALNRLLAPEPATSQVNPAAIQALLDKPMADLDGAQRTMNQWRGKVLVVNFWATWCPPCRKEVPEFVQAQARHAPRGLQIVGVAFDQPQPVVAFAREFRVNYPILVAGLDVMMLMREAGNRVGVLPYTIVLDRDGKLVHNHLGALTETDLSAVVLPLL